MDHVARDLSSDTESSSEAFIATLLHDKPEHKHLDVLTELLTRSSEINERVASSISAAWHWICENDLWSTRYESLSEYRKAIGYTETVRPIVQRQKKSERAKRSSIQTIFRYWNVPYDKALPINTRPLTWSKHLLSLIACLSKHRGHLDSVSLLEDSMKHRPERGRTTNRLMASDVQRALESLGIPQTRSATRESSQAKNSRISSSSARHKGTDGVAQAGSSSSTIHSEVSSLPNTPLSLGVSPTQGSRTSEEANEWLCCGCIPICLPLIALISPPEARLGKRLLAALVDWAHTISWGSFCSDHLMRLAQFILGDDPCDRTRTEVIQSLEALRSRECHSSICDHPSISGPNLCSNTELLSRYTGSADAWWRWQRDGFLHIPGFFSYMEELGVFKRVRKYLNRSGIKEDDSTLGQNMIQRCYRMLSQMVQRDPAYYAVLVACRPDRNSKLIHRPAQYQQRTGFQNDDVGFGVPVDRIKSMVQGEDTSDIQSTVIFPTCETTQKIRLVPGFHRQLKWLQSSLELKYGNGYKVFGEAQEIVLQPGDLVICLPQILRWPKTFSSSNFLNLSQIGLDNGFTATLEEPSERYDADSSKAWEQPEPQFHDAGQTMHKYQAVKVGLTEDSSCGVSSAIGHALAGRLDWDTDSVREEMNCILDSHGATAVEFVAKSRAHLARQFHKLCNSIERDSEQDSACGMDRCKERHYEPEFFQGELEYLETPKSFIDPLALMSPTWNNPSLDDIVAQLDHTFPQQPMSFNLP